MKEHRIRRKAEHWMWLRFWMHSCRGTRRGEPGKASRHWSRRVSYAMFRRLRDDKWRAVSRAVMCPWDMSSGKVTLVALRPVSCRGGRPGTGGPAGRPDERRD